MDFSFRDTDKRQSPGPSTTGAFGFNQRGQGVVEYLLVLIVAVSIILGGIYQLNTAFQTWANNYFGNYLACLLETGELPALGGTPGDSGICNQEFEPFSFTRGRPARPRNPTASAEESKSKPTKGTSDSASSGGRPVYQSAGGRFGGSSGSAGSNSRLVKLNRSQASTSETNTGSTAVSSYGSTYTSRERNRPIRGGRILDNSFATEREQREASKRQRVGSNTSRPDSLRKARVPYKPPKAKAQNLSESDDMTLGNFIRILLIAAILIALLMVIGGQLYSASKSAE